MRTRSLLIATAALLLEMSGAATVASAQVRRVLPPVIRRGPIDRRQPPAAIFRQLERLSQMSPEDRETQLSRLPPQRRQLIERRLNRYMQLSPEQRQRLRERYEAFEKLPVDRQDALRDELQYLRSLRPVLRRQRLNSPELQQSFSPDEQRLLRESLGMPDLP
jgi:uncharacterized protein DUF3106